MKKQSLPFALLTSFLVLAACAVILGIFVYYQIFECWVAFISIICAGLTYSCFFKKRTSGYYAWIMAWAIVLDFVSLFVATLLFIRDGNGSTMAEAVQTFGEAFTRAEFKRSFILSTCLSAGFTFLGGAFLLLVQKLYPKRKVENVTEEELLPPVNMKVENYIQDEQSPKLTKEEEETKKVADFYIKTLSRIVSIKDGDVVRRKLEQFDAKYVSKMTDQMKERVSNYILNQKYSGSEHEAAKVLLIKLK